MQNPLILSEKDGATLAETMTTKELAEQLGTDKKVIIENARKYLPNKIIEQGKQTLWTKAEVTVLIDGMKNNNSNQYREKGTVTGAVTVISTDLTPALKIKKAYDLAVEGYEEELAILKARNTEQQKVIEEQKPKAECYDNFLAREKFCNFRDASQYFGTSQTDFMNLLRSKYIYKNSVGEYRAYADYSDCFALRPFDKGKDRVGQQLMLTLKGLQYFGSFFQKQTV